MTKTISNILFQSAQTLKSNKTNNVTKLDIEYCLMEALGKNRAYLHAHGEEEISDQELTYTETRNRNINPKNFRTW